MTEFQNLNLDQKFQDFRKFSFLLGIESEKSIKQNCIWTGGFLAVSGLVKIRILDV